MKSKTDILLCICGEELEFEMVDGVPQPLAASCSYCGESFKDTAVEDVTNEQEMPEWVKDMRKRMDQDLMSETDKLYEQRVFPDKKIGY